MSEHKEDPQLLANAAEQEPASSSSGGSYRRAESPLAIESEDSGQRGRQAFGAIENRETADRSSPTDGADVLRRSITADQRGDGDDKAGAAAEEVKVDDALEQKALEDGVAAADESAQLAWDLTPHNL